jgi:hypothetical protein
MLLLVLFLVITGLLVYLWVELLHWTYQRLIPRLERRIWRRLGGIGEPPER